MKIARILAFRVELPLHETTYAWSGGKSVQVFDSTIVRVETDDGLAGHGEVCPLGPFYLPAYADGVRAGLRELGPHVIGADPRQLVKLNRTMDAALKGHPYVKSGIDIASRYMAENPGVEIVLPTTTVQDRLSLQRGKRTIDIRYFGRGLIHCAVR